MVPAALVETMHMLATGSFGNKALSGPILQWKFEVPLLVPHLDPM